MRLYTKFNLFCLVILISLKNIRNAFIVKLVDGLQVVIAEGYEVICNLCHGLANGSGQPVEGWGVFVYFRAIHKSNFTVAPYSEQYSHTHLRKSSSDYGAIPDEQGRPQSP